VAVDAGGEAPAVQITAPKEKRHVKMLTIVMQFSRPVFGFEARPYSPSLFYSNSAY